MTTICYFDKCELINLFAGGVIGGIIGLGLVLFYEHLINSRRQRRLKKLFRPLESSKGQFDWICYDIDGREKSKVNGSRASLLYSGGNEIELRVLESSGSEWVGKVTMLDDSRGTLTFSYPGKFEYGFKDCLLGYEMEDGKRFDYIILVGDGKSYYNELLRRERK